MYGSIIVNKPPVRSAPCEPRIRITIMDKTLFSWNATSLLVQQWDYPQTDDQWYWIGQSQDLVSWWRFIDYMTSSLHLKYDVFSESTDYLRLSCSPDLNIIYFKDFMLWFYIQLLWKKWRMSMLEHVFSAQSMVLKCRNDFELMIKLSHLYPIYF